MPIFNGWAGDGTMKIFVFLLSAVIGWAAVVPPPQPILKIGLVTETNSPITLSPLGWASVPVVVDLKNKIIFVPAGGGQFAASVVCSNQPVLAVEILAQSGHTNEVEWSTDLINWTPSNVRWVSDGLPVRYYIPQPVERRLYRVWEWNTPPLAQMVVSPLAKLPNATNWVVISPNNTDAEVVLDGSQSSDVENDPLQYFWEEGTNVFATDVNKTTKRLDLGHHTITLKVSDGIATNAASDTVKVIKASEAVDILMDLVRLDDEANLVPRNPRPLLASLEAASASFERGNTISGVNQLQAFQNQVWAQIVPFNQATTNLIQAAQEIIHAVTNSGTAASSRLGQEDRP